jgi:hypothetical protein
VQRRVLCEASEAGTGGGESIEVGEVEVPCCGGVSEAIASMLDLLTYLQPYFWGKGGGVHVVRWKLIADGRT